MNLIERSIAVENAFLVVMGQLQSLNNTINETKKMLISSEALLETKNNDLELSEMSIEVVKNLIGELSKMGVQKLQDLLSYGLQSIFFDKSYSVEIVISDRGDLKTADFVLVDSTDGKCSKTSLADSNGGGLQVVVSLILRIYFINVLNLRKLLIMDEALKEVSAKYVPTLFDFLQQTVTELGFKYLWATHEDRFVEYATLVYKVNNGSVKLLK